MTCLKSLVESIIMKIFNKTNAILREIEHKKWQYKSINK